MLAVFFLFGARALTTAIGSPGYSLAFGLYVGSQKR